MAIPSVTTTPPPSVSKAEASRTTLTKDIQSFLTLLTTQLKYQDPLAPMDSTKFTEQLAQFASVEQGIQTNKNLESLIGLTQAAQISTGVSYIGRQIEADTNVNALVNGKAEFLYNLPKAAASSAITIRDAKGQVVYTTTAEKAVGSHSFVWDGRGTNGATLPDGIYSASVAALDSGGNQISASVHSLAHVDGVVMSNGTVSVLVGDVAIPLDKIVSVKESSTALNTGQ